MSSTPQQIENAVNGLVEEVPALRKLKLVFGVDLKAKGDVQTYRVEMPGPVITKGRGEDERCRVEIDRQQFNQLSDAKAKVPAYRRAAETCHIRFEGDPNVAKLVIRVIESHEQRASIKKVH